MVIKLGDNPLTLNEVLSRLAYLIRSRTSKLFVVTVLLLLFGGLAGLASSMVFDYQTAERLIDYAFTAQTSFSSSQLTIDYTLPGMFFGIGLALIYLQTAFSMGRVAKSLLIITFSTLCYATAFWIVYIFYLSFWLIPLRPAGIAGALATFALLFFLEYITATPIPLKKKLLISLLGGILGAILFGFFTYGRTLPYYVDPMTVSLMGNLIFFVGWQSIMMVAIGLPIVRPETSLGFWGFLIIVFVTVCAICGGLFFGVL